MRNWGTWSKIDSKSEKNIKFYENPKKSENGQN